MLEQTIYLEGVEPVMLYGTNNVHFNTLKDHFSKLKLIARGHELKAIGEQDEIHLFTEKVNELIAFCQHHNQLSASDVENILSLPSGGTPRLAPKDGIIVFGNSGTPVKARTINQRALVDQYYHNDLIFALGPAGTGKTYTAIALAVRALRDKEVKRIILTRPAVEAGERLGFLPGDLKDKLDPYLQPLYDALNDMIPSRRLATFMEEGVIQIAPLAYMRGRTLDHAFVILDEAQNATLSQLKMFLTRMGKNAKFIVTGDVTQIDLPRRDDSGLPKIIPRMRPIDGVAVIDFDERDIVRHPLVKHIIDAFNALSGTMPAQGT